MAVAGIVLSALSSVLSAGGSLYEGQEAKDAAEYNAKVLEQDAIAAENKADYDEDAYRKQVKSFLSEQKAIIGASGVDLSGSTLLATLDTIEQGELDALAIRAEGEEAVRGFMSAAELSREAGKTAETSSYFKAGSSLLTGASSFLNS